MLLGIIMSKSSDHVSDCPTASRGVTNVSGFAHHCVPNVQLRVWHTEGTQHLWNELTLSDVGPRTQLVVSLGFSPQTWLSLVGGQGGPGTLQIQVSNVPQLKREPSPEGGWIFSSVKKRFLDS